MFFRLLFLLTFIPFVEIYFLISLSDSIGWSNTLLVIFATGVIGAWLLRKQGHSILMQIQQSTMQNEMPSDAIAKGFFTFIGGLLLLTPGILTDVIGLSLIFPPTQFLWKQYFKGQWQRGMTTGQVQFYSFHRRPRDPDSQNPFERSEPRAGRFDTNVIDIRASQSKTIDKKEE